jgi:hypothetical protein
VQAVSNKNKAGASDSRDRPMSSPLRVSRQCHARSRCEKADARHGLQPGAVQQNSQVSVCEMGYQIVQITLDVQKAGVNAAQPSGEEIERGARHLLR